jgi:glucose/arabinose dehydrogenase
MLEKTLKATAAMILSSLLVAPAFALSSGATPVIEDPDFAVEKFVSGGNSPTTMAFVGSDILVLQKNTGEVKLIRDGALQERPVIDVSVASAGEQGMLGIAAVGTTVYLYFIESSFDGGEAIAKRVYKYEWDGSALADPVLIKDMTATQRIHNGGGMAVGQDGSVYLVVGDSGRFGVLQNNGGEYHEDTSVIMRVDAEEPYYAVGVRNSFGLAIDPITGKLWDTENGANGSDEINLVERGFNSGWRKIMGPVAEGQTLPQLEGYAYSDPEFSWQPSVAPTALTFVDSEPLAKFRDSLFVGDCNTGTLYQFTLNEARDGFAFENPELSDSVLNSGDSTDDLIFGSGFGCVTDLDVGPDGLLYVTSLSENTIFRILPISMADVDEQEGQSQYAYYIIVATVAGGAAYVVWAYRRRA